MCHHVVVPAETKLQKPKYDDRILFIRHHITTYRSLASLLNESIVVILTCMKFGKQLVLSSRKQWREFYIDYSALKERIKAASSATSEPGQRAFVLHFLYLHNLTRIQTYMSRHLQGSNLPLKFCFNYWTTSSRRPLTSTSQQRLAAPKNLLAFEI